MTYLAVTKNRIINCTDLLRIAENGVIEQYDLQLGKWRSADSGMSGVYCGAIECETITETEAEEIIKMWQSRAK